MKKALAIINTLEPYQQIYTYDTGNNLTNLSHQANSNTWQQTLTTHPNNHRGSINRNNHQKPTFHLLGDFLNPALALLGQGLKKSPSGQKLDFANHPYLLDEFSFI
jgi:hypothetical protein